MEIIWIVRKNEKNIFLTRNSYGEGEVVYQLWVDGLGGEIVPVEVSLRERSYLDTEIEVVFDRAMEQVQVELLAENHSLTEVRSDLKLVSEVTGLGVTLNWSSADPELIDSFGKLNSDHIPEQGINTYLMVQLSSGKYTAERRVDLTVYPKIQSPQQTMINRFLEMIDTIDRNQQLESGIWLPPEYDGHPLRYQTESAPQNEVFLVLGVLLSGLFYIRDETDRKKKGDKRRRQMQQDYSEIVSRFMIFIGAGMTVRKAWEYIVRDYEKLQKENPKLCRYAYEAMCHTWSEINSGIAEGKAYENFGKNCGLNSYLKLSGLLEQSRKTGSKNLRHQLNEEMQDALEARKQIARKLGEEAGTKLLFPLFLLLGIVMAMIMIPAVWSMI